MCQPMQLTLVLTLQGLPWQARVFLPNLFCLNFFLLAGEIFLLAQSLFSIFFLAGESGGGYICSAAMVQLALKGEAGLVKIAIPVVPMLDDYEFNCRLSMTAEESEGALMMQKIWQAIAGPDFESKRKDPLLFPGKASPELFAKMPPTIVWEDEFDMYITPATR